MTTALRQGKIRRWPRRGRLLALDPVGVNDADMGA
jgi:hypothetical protein